MFPEWFVEKFLVWTNPGDVVFDPFSGRGTTVFQSLLSERNAGGCDTNPVAVCLSNAKADPPTESEANARLAELRDSQRKVVGAETDFPFFRACFHPDTLIQVLYLRQELDWRSNRVDRFLAALALGALHGESHRSPRYFSNQMPRTISTKPDYSIRWWKKKGSVAPKRDVFEILSDLIAFRFASRPASLTGRVVETDARLAAQAFPEFHGRVSLVVTSPPYLDTTNFEEDQWLRIWFLGGPTTPTRRPGSDDRHRSGDRYWQFLEEVWRGMEPLMQHDARIVVRIGGKKMTRSEILDSLTNSLGRGMGRTVSLIDEHTSEVTGSQLRSFLPDVTRPSVEHDFHFQMA